MRIHLQLNGNFSYFSTRSFTLDEQLNWDDYPVVYLTPDSDRWDPQATHYADAEAVMIDNCGEIVDRECIKTTIFESADISDLSHVHGRSMKTQLMPSCNMMTPSTLENRC